MPTTITPALYERMADRLRHALQYAEAARVMAEGALELLRGCTGGGGRR